MPEHYRLLGGPGSPYSLKLRAILRYRQLPHRWIVPRGYLATEGELARAGKQIIPVLQYPDGSYWADSTPLAYALEVRHPGQRSIIPGDPGMAFLSHLIEDLADEVLLLTKRPTRVAEILPYGDARPRTTETLSEASFIHAKKRSLEVFQREVRR